MTTSKQVIKWLAALAVLLGLASSPLYAKSDLAIAPTNITLTDNQVLAVYYFHGNMRCHSCKQIETLTRNAIEQAYSQELQAGQVNLIMVNLEADGNAHYIDDFQLITRSVVIAIEEANQVVEYHRLDGVWQLYNQPQQFTNYIYQQIGSLIDEPQTQLPG